MASSAADIRRLREELETRFGGAVLPAGAPAPERSSGFRTGIAAIDGLLPAGVPRGALSLWTGEATAGRTAALRALVLHACAEGARVALIDAGLTLDAGFARTPGGIVDGLWVVRPPDSGRAAEGAWAAEALLRAGVFDLVILDGCLPDAAQAHRLRALARERNAAVMVTAGARSEERGASDFRRGIRPVRRAPASTLSHSSALPTCAVREPDRARLLSVSDERTSHLAPRSSLLPFRADVRLEFRRAEGIGAGGLRPGGRFRQRARVRAGKESGGSFTRGGEREVELVYEPTDRLCSHPPVPDRSTGRR